MPAMKPTPVVDGAEGAAFQTPGGVEVRPFGIFAEDGEDDEEVSDVAVEPIGVPADEEVDLQAAYDDFRGIKEDFNFLDSFVGVAESSAESLTQGLASLVGFPTDILNLAFLKAREFGRDVEGPGTFKGHLAMLEELGADPAHPVTRGVARAFSFGDPVERALGRGIGMMYTPKPVGSMEDFAKLADFATFGHASPDLSTPGRRFGARVSQEVAASLPFTAGVGIAARTARQIAKPPALQGAVRRYARDNPMKFALTETTIAGAAGAGAHAALSVHDSAGSEISGAVAAALTMSGLFSAPRLYRTLGTSFTRSITKEGHADHVAAVLRESAGDPDKAARTIEANINAGNQGTSAQMSEDAGLLALERSTVDANGRLGTLLNDSNAEANMRVTTGIREALSGSGPTIKAAQQYARGHIDEIVLRLDGRVRLAIRLAQERVRGVEPSISRAEQSTIARQEFELAYRAAVQDERALWGAVQGQVRVHLKPIRDVLFDVVTPVARGGSRRQADPALPPDIVRMLGVKGTTKPLADAPLRGMNAEVDEIIALRSDILSRIRALRSGPEKRGQAKLIGYLERLQEAALVAMKATEAQAAVGSLMGNNIRAANAMTAHINLVFHQGPIGRIMGFNGKPGGTLPEMTLEGFPLAGQAGGERADTLTAAADFLQPGTGGGRTRLRRAVEGSMMRLFLDSVTNAAGKVSADAMAFFTSPRRFGPFMDRFPESKKVMENVAKAQHVSDLVVRKGERRINFLESNRNRATLFVGNSPEKAMGVIIGMKNPVNRKRAMQEIVDISKGDKTGEALQGLKQGFHDFFLNKVLGNQILAGERVVRAPKIREWLDKLSPELKILYADDPGTLRRMRLILEDAERVQAHMFSSAGAGPRAFELHSMFFQTFGKIVGARIGGAIGRSALVVAGAGGQAANALLRWMGNDDITNLIQSAFFDSKVMADLLRRPVSLQEQDAIVARVRGHLVSLGIRAQDDETLDENSPQP